MWRLFKGSTIMTSSPPIANLNVHHNLSVAMSGIAPLPPQTRSILRSTIILPSLVSLVSELIQNSLDANASNLEISIDCEEWSCSVQDDGGGISKDDLDVIANTDQPGISSRYSTSKTHGTSNAYPTTLGFRGEGM